MWPRCCEHQAWPREQREILDMGIWNCIPKVAFCLGRRKDRRPRFSRLPAPTIYVVETNYLQQVTQAPL